MLRVILGLFFIVFLLIIGGIFANQCATCTGRHKSVAEKQAWQFAKETGLESQLSGISCAGQDSDGNGYVTCTFVLNDKKKTQRKYECAAALTMNTGCKIPSVLVSTDHIQ